jgi:hypothetical protein
MDLLIRLKEWGRRRGRPVSDPDPADRLAGNAFAADLIQRDKDRPCSIYRQGQGCWRLQGSSGID